MTNSINLIRGTQNIIDLISGEIFVISWVAADYLHPQNSAVAIVLGTLDPGSSPYATFPSVADAITYYEAAQAQNVLDLVNADIGLPYYTAYTITAVDPVVIAAIMTDLTPYLTLSDAASTYVPQTTTINSHALNGNVTITKSDISLGNVVNLDTSTTANITDSSGKRFVTDSQKTVLMGTSGTNTGDQDLSGLVSNTRTVNGHALTGNVTVAYSDLTGSPTIPTATSQLTNDAGFLTSAPVTSVNGHTGAVVIAQSDISGLTSALSGKQPAITTGTTSQYLRGDLSLATFPTAVSQLANDSSFISSSGAPVQSVNGHTGTVVIAQSDISGLTTTLASKQSAITVGSTSQYLRGDLSLATFPSIPSAQINSDWNATSGVSQITNKPTLATVATSGSYSDLSGKPSLATVATSGSYLDLSNKPSIPKIYFGTTLQTAAIIYTASATVASGVAVFQLTADGTSTGAAIFPNGPNMDSINAFVSDATASYQMGYALTNSNKTLTITANKLTTANILTGILGQLAANGAIVRLTLIGS